MASSERLALMRAHAGAAAACIDPSAVPSGFGGVDATSDRSRESEGATARNTVVMADPRRVADANGTCDANGMQRTQYPYVTGTSVLALKFKGGVMIAADTLGSYGATKRYKSVPRVRDVGSHMVIGAGGELSDYNYIMSLLDELMTDEFCYDDGIKMEPRQLHEYLSRVMYNRRNKMDPLWNSLVVGGVGINADTGEVEPYIGSVGMIGTHFSSSHIATGFGQHLARPLFRNEQSDDMSEADAEALIKKALKVCFYRDKNSINKFTLKVVTKNGIQTKGPFSVETEWNLKAFSNPTKDSVGGW